MTKVFFVRHAQPDFAWEDDRTRPLTAEGMADRGIVLEILQDKAVDVFYCSPYKRSIDTIAESAAYFGKEIITDERLREREKGVGGNTHGMFEKRWADHDYHEEDGESIRMVQERNMAAFLEIIKGDPDKNIVIGTHGTALSTISNFYDPTFGCKDFLRIIDWMPYVLEMDFDGETLVSKKEHGHIEKAFKGRDRADQADDKAQRAMAEKIVETERLLLRKMDRSDLPQLRQILQDQEVMYAYEGAFDEEETQKWLDKQLTRYQEDGFGLYAVILKETGRMIGQCGLTLQDIPGDRVLEIGYLFQKAYWHKGYATEAARACRDYAFTVWDAREVFSIIRDTNIPSQKVAQRNGMVKIGTFVKHYRGVDMPHHIFSVKRKERS